MKRKTTLLCISFIIGAVSLNAQEKRKKRGKEISTSYEIRNSSLKSPIGPEVRLGRYAIEGFIPTKLPKGENWKLLETFSDEFNYKGKGPEFRKKWKDTYFNGWTGPGLTIWNADNTDVKNGNLIVEASRKPGTDKVYCGVVTSKKPVKYPLYTEVRAKVANQVLSSNFWFLSPDDEREIDMLEIYGSDRPDHKWFAARPSSNYHVFVRDETTHAIKENLNDQHHHTLPNEEPWRNKFHTFGVYWKDPFTLDFYYDGKLVRELRKEGIKDPEGLGLDRKSFMIIDLEDHDWRSDAGNVATNAELSNNSKNKYLVDYVRTYRPIPADAKSKNLIANGSFDKADLSGWHWQRGVILSKNAEGNTNVVTLPPETKIIQKIKVAPNTKYELTWDTNGEKGAEATLEITGYRLGKSIAPKERWTTSTMNFKTGKEPFVYLVIKSIGNKKILLDDFYLEEVN